MCFYGSRNVLGRRVVLCNILPSACNSISRRFDIACSAAVLPTRAAEGIDNNALGLHATASNGIIKWQSFRQPNHYHKKTCITEAVEEKHKFFSPIFVQFVFGERSYATEFKLQVLSVFLIFSVSDAERVERTKWERPEWELYGERNVNEFVSPSTER